MNFGAEITGKDFSAAEAVIYPDNISSRKAFEKAGFRYVSANPDGDVWYYEYQRQCLDISSNDYLYHGSIVPDIKSINADSKFFNSDKHVVYLTDNIPYALLYIWDKNHNKKAGKHVTAALKNGIVIYEEQFPNQIKTFYDGVTGFLYMTDRTSECLPVIDRKSMFYSENNAVVVKTERILNVYDEFLRFEKNGLLRVTRFEDVPYERIRNLYSHMEKSIISKGIIHNPECDEALFYKAYFPSVWENALNKNTL